VRKRWAAGIVGAIALAVGGFAGVAYASTSTDVGSFGLDIKQVQETFTSPPTGAQNYKAQCAVGYTPIGGGGLAVPTTGNAVVPLNGSAPYDDGNLGWEVNFSIPSGAWTVYVYASCVKIS
jgi:hypothetical protein